MRFVFLALLNEICNLEGIWIRRAEIIFPAKMEPSIFMEIGPKLSLHPSSVCYFGQWFSECARL